MQRVTTQRECKARTTLAGTCSSLVNDGAAVCAMQSSLRIQFSLHSYLFVGFFIFS